MKQYKSADDFVDEWLEKSKNLIVESVEYFKKFELSEYKYYHIGADAIYIYNEPIGNEWGNMRNGDGKYLFPFHWIKKVSFGHGGIVIINRVDKRRINK